MQVRGTQTFLVNDILDFIQGQDASSVCACARIVRTAETTAGRVARGIAESVSTTVVRKAKLRKVRKSSTDSEFLKTYIDLVRVQTIEPERCHISLDVGDVCLTADNVAKCRSLDIPGSMQLNADLC